MTDIQLVVRRILRKRYSERLLRLEDVIVSTASDVLGLDISEAEVFAYQKYQFIWNEILRQMDEEARRGFFPTFEVIDGTRYELAWHPHIRHGEDRRYNTTRLRLSSRGDILDYIEDHVDDRDYEALGCVVAQIAGASRWHLTPRGNEFGIDFLAIIPSYGKTHLFPGIHKQIKLVGQSKKWTSKVKREKVDDLAHKLDYIRARSHHVDRVIPSWFTAAKGIVVGCMLAHSGTQSGGHVIADDHGIILADSRDVAELLILCKQWDITLGSAGLADFLRRAIDTVLATDLATE